MRAFCVNTGVTIARLAVILTLCALPAVADEPGVWGELTVPVFQTNRVTATTTVEFRSDETFPRNTFIGRYAAAARFPVSHGWSVRVGYSSFLRGNDLVRLGWQRALSGGISYPLGTTRLIGSTIYEHHWLPAGRGERDRLRQRFEFTWPRKPVSPWLYEDLALENGRGLFRSWSRAGVSFALPHGWQVRTGYQFQALQRGKSTAWAPRHAVLLQLRLPPLFDLKKKKATKTTKPSQPEPESEATPEGLDEQ